MGKIKSMNNPDKFSRDQLKFYFILLPVMVVVALPLIYVVFHAFKPIGELNSYPPVFVTLSPTLDNFRNLFAISDEFIYPLTLYIFNSITISVITVILVLIICSSAGYVLSKKKFRGSKLIMSANQAALMFVPIAMAIPRFLIIKNIGLYDNFLVNIFPLLAMPVGVFLVKQFIDQVPPSLIDAAKIDGCSDYGILFKIVIPAIKPALATVGILAFQISWNTYEASQLFLESEKLKTFPYFLSSLNLAASGSPTAQGMAAAATLILIIPNIVLFIIMQSRVMNTVSHSGIK